MSALAQERGFNIVEWVERCERNEIVARELVRTQSMTASRTSLLRWLEQDSNGRWRVMGDSVTPFRFLEIQRSVVAAEEQADMREEHFDPLRERWRKVRPRGDEGRTATRIRPLGIPHATIESWIRNELRPCGYLKPSTGPGRPRRDAPKYELGPYFDELESFEIDVV